MSRVIIDVREPIEYATGHVQGAINIPPSKLMRKPKELDGLAKDTELVLYCVSGSRSNASMHFLRAMGFTNLVNGINKQQVEARFAK
jgi:rhodanese-related sulfurtransferase